MARAVRALAVAALGTALALGTAAGAGAIPPEPPHDQRELGGVDLAQFCVAFGYRDLTLLDPGTVWDWRCVEQDGGLVDLNMSAACQWQYREQWAKPGFRDEWDGYSWYCYLD